MLQIFLVFQFSMMFLFCPETTYIRESRFETDIADRKTETVETETKAVVTHEIPPKKSFVQELAVFTGVYSKNSIFKFLLGPFITLLNPAACYAIIASGLLNSWYVGSAIILSGIFAGPPWNFDAAQIGYIGAGPFIGGAIGSAFCGVAGDRVIKNLTRRNKGI